jgi:hypothetical protein
MAKGKCFILSSIHIYSILYYSFRRMIYSETDDLISICFTILGKVHMMSEQKLAILAIIISVISLVIGIAHVEYGVIFGNTKYHVSMLEKISIQNDYQGLQLTTNFTFHNEGTKPLRIDKVAGLLKLNSEYHIFITQWTGNITPKTVLNSDITINEKMSDVDNTLRSNFGVDVMNDLLEKYQNGKTITDKIFLSDKLYVEAKEILKANITWIKPDDNYYLLVLIWINNTDREPTLKKYYKYKMTSDQIKILSEYQMKSYKLPRPEAFTSNKFVTYSSISDLEEMTTESSVNDAYSGYRQLETTQR